MRNRKILIILIAIGVLAGVLLYLYKEYMTGGASTPKELFDSYQESLKKTESISVYGNVSVNIENDVMPIPMTVELDSSTNLKDKMHANIEATIGIMGQNTNFSVEAYMYSEDSKMHTYTKSNQEEIWSHTVEGAKDTEIIDIQEIFEKLDNINDISELKKNKN